LSCPTLSGKLSFALCSSVRLSDVYDATMPTNSKYELDAYSGHIILK